MKLTTDIHPKLIFNGVNVDSLLERYDTPNNLSDVAVVKNDGQKMMNLVNIEVNSSPIEQTISKTIHGLIQLARIVKCHEQVEEVEVFHCQIYI